jgi:hypothetical protein
MMDALQSNRKLSSSAEKVKQNTYASIIEAAKAFYSGGAMADTKKNKIEHTCIIIRVDTPIRDADGSITIQPRYMISKTFTGSFNYIGNETMKYIAGLKAAGIEYSVAHTHPKVSGQDDEHFSGLGGIGSKDWIGDYKLNKWFGANNVYMANEHLDNIYVCDIDGPEMDQDEPGKYYSVGHIK